MKTKVVTAGVLQRGWPWQASLKNAVPGARLLAMYTGPPNLTFTFCICCSPALTAGDRLCIFSSDLFSNYGHLDVRELL
jgi:hypothetical protein